MKYILLLLLLSASAFAQTKFYLMNGNSFEGFIIESFNDSLKIDTGSSVRTINKKIIKKVLKLKTMVKTLDGKDLLVHITKDTPNSIIGSDAQNNIITLRKKDIIFSKTEYAFETEPYSTFGLTAFFPGGLNLQYGRHINKYLGFRVHLGTTILDVEDPIIGVQLDALYNLDKEKSFEQNLSLSLGHAFISYDDPDFSYLGFLYDFNYHGFFMQFGPALSLNDNYSTLQIVGNIGFVIRFNN